VRCRLAAVALVSTGFLALSAAPALATTYFVSPTGNDAAAGTSQADAWRTVRRVDDARLQPGDVVRFQGGAVFADATLMPGQSGAPGSPITFTSYGTGRATIANGDGAVWFAGKSWLAFDHLRLTTNGTSANVFAGSASGGSTHITLSSSVVANTKGIGVIAPNPADAFWTIRATTVSHVGDSGLIMLGGPHLVTRNTVTDTGWNAAITWGKHGIYSKGPDQTISYNDFSRNVDGQAISIRFHGARVVGNTIHDTPAAIAFFDYDTSAPPQGTSYVTGNRAWNITDYGFYYDGQLDPQGRRPTVDFVFSKNRFTLANPLAEAINVSPSGSATVTVVGNVFRGIYGNALRSAQTTIARDNLFGRS
jgi:hypothetical protein